MVARSSNKKVEAVQLEDAADRPAPSPRRKRCAYCVPAGKKPSEPEEHHDECLIKMLGTSERKEVSLTLYRAGRRDGLFTKQCPMSSDHAYDDCPFYEDESTIPEE
jgi:hypothetical protein